MKLTISSDFGLIRGDADREEMFRGVDGAQTYRAMVNDLPMRNLSIADKF